MRQKKTTYKTLSHIYIDKILLNITKINEHNHYLILKPEFSTIKWKHYKLLDNSTTKIQNEERKREKNNRESDSRIANIVCN